MGNSERIKTPTRVIVIVSRKRHIGPELGILVKRLLMPLYTSFGRKIWYLT
jgi:hypothetical protein